MYEITVPARGKHRRGIFAGRMLRITLYKSLSFRTDLLRLEPAIRNNEMLGRQRYSSDDLVATVAIHSLSQVFRFSMVNNGYPRGTGQSPSPFIFSSVPTNGNRAQPAVDSQNNVHWQHEVQRVQKENKVLRQTVATLETKVHELTSRLEATEQQIKTRDLIWAEELKKAVQEARNEARLGSAFVRSTTQARVSKSSALWENQSDTESEADEDECTRTAYCRPSTGSSRNHRVAKIPKRYLLT
ncbi:hypothetical protein K474DRAFT_1679048 [Panus rudis PR-1116 ss-1]|nr:hypothetical protein K474DRAFT_1679048 [Panus rudis PR-1116 ss-1]